MCIRDRSGTCPTSSRGGRRGYSISVPCRSLLQHAREDRERHEDEAARDEDGEDDGEGLPRLEVLRVREAERLQHRPCSVPQVEGEAAHREDVEERDGLPRLPPVARSV